MARKRARAVVPFAVVAPVIREFPAIFAVRAEDRVEANKPEREAWQVFLRWCCCVPEGTRVELLRGDRVIAWLGSAGTRRPLEDRLHA